jgi:hypothetical protein
VVEHQLERAVLVLLYLMASVADLLEQLELLVRQLELVDPLVPSE